MDGAQTLKFTAETGQVLNLVIHSLYSRPEIFLRELVSNAADALDKLRLQGLQDPALLDDDADLRVEIEADATARTVTVRDNGVGMSRDEVVEHLGTIAHSGTAEFARRLKETGQGAESLIGQFGVGFYSAFIVADRVEVRTRRADLGADAGVVWRSDGQTDYVVEPLERAARGTEVVLHLKADQDEFLAPARLEHIVHTYSEYLPFAVRLKGEGGAWNTVNRPQALWTRPRGEITADEYQQYYRELTHDFEAPLTHLHARIEGSSHAYTALLYLPARAPAWLWDPTDRHGVRLYVRRVFILEDSGQVLPRWLRFVRGVVDSDDLPLNVSREMLQGSRVVDAIRAGCTRRVLELLENLARDEPDQYARFWQAFGRVLKEGVVDDPAQRERLAKLLRFASTADAEALTGLDDYVARMPADQDAIWYLLAERADVARLAPHLEAFRARGTEVLLLTDPVDPWVAETLREYAGKPLRSVADNELPGSAEVPPPADDGLCARLAEALGERAGAVRVSTRLTDSPACLVPAQGGLPPSLARTLRAAGHAVPSVAPTLEINPAHALVKTIGAETDATRFADLAHVLLDTAALAQGEAPEHGPQLAARVHRLLAGLPGDGANAVAGSRPEQP